MKKKYFKLSRPYVFVPMCADYLHHGHINILQKASKYGNVIVGLMTDKAITNYKSNKSFLNFNNRKKIVISIKYVKRVLTVKRLDFVSIAKKYKFDYVLHGDDWKKGTQASKRKALINVMKNWKGKVVDVKYTKNISSTLIRKKIKNDRSYKKNLKS
jgi:phosphoenolpyruvate phosphomutase